MDSRTPTVLLVSGDAALSPSFGYQVSSAFIAQGWHVDTFNYRKLHVHQLPVARQIMSRLLVKRAQALKPDLVLCLKGNGIAAGTISALRKLGIITANWCLDEPFGTFGPQNKVSTISEYDAFFIFDDYYVDLIGRAGARHTVFLPCSSDPNLVYEEAPLSSRFYTHDASFIGCHYANREKLLDPIADLDIAIWGHRWKKINPNSALFPKVQPDTLWADRNFGDLRRMCGLWNSTRCNINIHHPQSLRSGANLRFFDLMASKSFQLCDALPGLNDIAEPLKDTITYSSSAELSRAIQYFSQEQSERHKIVEHAYATFIKRHTTRHRVAQILSELDLH